MKKLLGLFSIFNPMVWFRIIGIIFQGIIFGLSKLFGRPAMFIARQLMKVQFLKKVPGIKIIFDENFDLAAYMREKDSKNKKLGALRRGDLDKARENLFPKKRYAWLHRRYRVDQKPPIVIDSKLPDGRDTSWLAYRYMTDGVLNMTFRDRALESIRDGVAVFLLFFAATFVTAVFPLNIEINFGLQSILGDDPFITWNPEFVFAAPVVADTWSTGTPFTAYLAGAGKLALSVAFQTILNPFAYIVAAAFMLISYLSIGFSNLQGVVKEAAKAALVETKAEKIMHRYNAADRENNQKALVAAAEYNDNVLAKKKFNGGVLLGHSTGQLVARNADPYIHSVEGAPWYMGYEEIFGHFGIMGNTGSGKTSTVLKRVLPEVAKIDRMGMMLIDYKSVLPFEILEQFRKDIPEKLESKLRIIGTGNVDGTPDYGVNLLEGIRPDILKGLIQSVMEQTEKEAGSDYFDKASYQLLEHAARLTQAWQYTKEGREWAIKTGRTPYNLMLMIDIVERDDIRLGICKDIVNNMGAFAAAKTKSGYAIASLDLKSLRASLRYMGGTGESTWGGMSDRQKSGVIGTFQTIVSSLNSNPVLRERFFEGRITGKNVSIPEAIEKGYIMPVNISSEEDGMAGIFAVTLMKTQVFAETSRRQKIMAKQGKNPQIESPFCLMIDEAQNFITAGNISMSDAKVLNTARSTGLSICYGFQNINSLEKRIGKENVKDILANLTTKMTLVNSENDTAEYFSKQFGDSMRLRTHHEGQYENFYQAAKELGMKTPEEFEKTLAEDERYRAAIYTVSNRPKNLYNLVQKIQKIPAYTPNSQIQDIIDSFPVGGGGAGAAMASLMSGGGAGTKDTSGNEIAQKNALIGFLQREEDKKEHALMTGNEYRPLLPVSEVSELPQGHAIVEWKTANFQKKDIVKLLPGIY